ncbi:MAG: hypothetical protein RR141_07785, partial [Rikenellaceae bacterium]
ILRKVDSGMNYTDMRFNSIKIIAEDFHLLGDSINMKLNHLRLTEKSGLHLSKITTDSLTLSSSKIAVKDADLRLDNSWVALRDFSLNYHDWTMSDFLDKVVMRATITDSHIEMATIEKFTMGKRGWRSQLRFKGNCEGVVSNLSGHISLVESYGSSIRGAKFNLKGLPDIKKTMFKIELFDLNTSAADIYHIIDDFTGSVPKQNNILKNAGNINLSGEFDGSFERFKSKGVIKTLEGKIDFQVSNTKVQDAVKIAGSVSTKNFNSGMLFGVNKLGNVDFQGNIDSYLAKDSVNVDINSKIDSLTYLGYRYSDIAVNGTLTDKTFKGYIGIGDKNLNLDFN